MSPRQCVCPVNTTGWLWGRRGRGRAERQRLVFSRVVIGSRHTNEGGPKSEIGGGGVAGWLKSPPQQQFLLSWAVSTVFLCLYLVLPVIWPVKRRFAWRTEGWVEGWAVRRTGGQVGQFLYPAKSSVHHCGRAACILWIYLCLRLWVTPGKARRNLRDRRQEAAQIPCSPRLSLPPSIHPSILCVCVDDLCSSVSK